MLLGLGQLGAGYDAGGCGEQQRQKQINQCKIKN